MPGPQFWLPPWIPAVPLPHGGRALAPAPDTVNEIVLFVQPLLATECA